MKKRFVLIVALAMGFGGLAWFGLWQTGGPRRAGLAALEQLDSSLRSGSAAALLDQIVLPAALAARTPAEQAEFITKALRDEISSEGLALLKRDGRFGPLTNLFPLEAQSWATQAGVRPEDCMAFRLDRPNAPRAEVVLVRIPDPSSATGHSPPPSFRIVRCNNVRQLTDVPTAVMAAKPAPTQGPLHP